VAEHGTNPLLADTDRDGLSDGEELNEHKTSPLDPDTDGSGLTDGEELQKHKTDPNLGDSDGDGLGDGAEVAEHGTNPLLADTDRDGSLDLIEVKAGTDPNNPFEYPATRYNPDIGDRPAITVPPDDKEVILGGTVSFKVKARNGTLSYRWIKLGKGAVGTNQNVLQIDNVGHDDIGFYVVLVSNKFGTIYSRTVRLGLITETGKPRLDIIFNHDNRMTIEITGDLLHSYEIQYSRDLKEWRSLDYNPLKTNDRGKTRLVLNIAPESMHAFFRLTE
ncbi:MAG: immunoglobulin domain-containing protein, partial [Proteobacteria bacterium]|nr:immunoglobulin domain-containing protein [Pseudomonadota bacterium]